MSCTYFLYTFPIPFPFHFHFSFSHSLFHFFSFCIKGGGIILQKIIQLLRKEEDILELMHTISNASSILQNTRNGGTFMHKLNIQLFRRSERDWLEWQKRKRKENQEGENLLDALDEVIQASSSSYSTSSAYSSFSSTKQKRRREDHHSQVHGRKTQRRSKYQPS